MRFGERSSRFGLWCTSALVVAFLATIAACARPSQSTQEGLLAALVARQRAYATEQVSPEEWADLAEDFLRYADANGSAPDSNAALFGAGISYVFAGEGRFAEDAISAFERYLAQAGDAPNVPNALYWSARAYERLGTLDRARRFYQRLVDRYPSSRYAEDAAERLQERPTPSPTGPFVAEGAANHSPRTSPAPNEQEIGVLGSLPRQLGLAVKVVVIDPGHGGHDSGTVAARGMPERDVVLDIARRLAAALEADGFQARLTRDDDHFVSLRDRNELGRRWEADLFISIHANEADDTRAEGVETWIAAPAQDEAAARVAARENLGEGALHELTERVADLLSETKQTESRVLARAIQKGLIEATGAVDRGVKEAAFLVLLGLRVPSVLVEVGFLSNESEARRLARPAYRERLAAGIARGVRDYAASLRAMP